MTEPQTNPQNMMPGAMQRTQRVRVTITSAQLLALNASPITLVSAPGAGKALIFEGLLIQKPAGTAYAGIAAVAINKVRYAERLSQEALVRSNFERYFAPNVALDPTLALRVGGKKVWGTFPFFEAAFLGGATTLRGFNEQRFAGDAAVYANAELRLFLTEFRLLLPGDFGIFGLADIGRVFLDGDASDTWHKAAGGGIWFAFIDRGSTISLAIAQSKEQRAFYASVGFML